jgi:hypothetical protein
MAASDRGHRRENANRSKETEHNRSDESGLSGRRQSFLSHQQQHNQLVLNLPKHHNALPISGRSENLTRFAGQFNVSKRRRVIFCGDLRSSSRSLEANHSAFGTQVEAARWKR